MPMYKSSGPQDEKSNEDENGGAVGGGIKRKGNGERGENDDNENVRHAPPSPSTLLEVVNGRNHSSTRINRTTKRPHCVASTPHRERRRLSERL
ncbi:hypothetical protein PAXINDRAFT_103650, partial [Paxillus involutus ATCC 200175]